MDGASTTVMWSSGCGGIVRACGGLTDCMDGASITNGSVFGCFTFSVCASGGGDSGGCCANLVKFVRDLLVASEIAEKGSVTSNIFPLFIRLFLLF